MSVLTKLEEEFLEILEKNNCEDDYNCTEEFSYFNINSVCNYEGLDSKIIRGVVSSLIKKGVVTEENKEHGVQYFGYEFKEKEEV